MAKFKQTKIYLFNKQKGINKKQIKDLCVKKGTNPNNKTFKLKIFYFNYISNLVVNKLNIKQMKKNIKFFWQIKIYRGIRHMLNLPVHGQRTKTNSKTKRKFNYFK